MSETRVRPRPGDLEAATTPHPFQPSGEYLGYGRTKERCDLCGLVQQGEGTHHDVTAPTSRQFSTRATAAGGVAS